MKKPSKQDYVLEILKRNKTLEQTVLTCSRENFRLAFPMIASKKQIFNSTDVTTAFLQGKAIERTVHARPPKEASTNQYRNCRNEDYGLADASRFIKLGTLPVTLDKGILIWTKEHKVIGTAVCVSDDVLWGGNKEFVIKQLKGTVKIGTQHKKIFDYIGVHLQENT